MSSRDGTPTQNAPHPLLVHQTAERQFQWLKVQASNILQDYLLPSEDMEEAAQSVVSEEAAEMSAIERLIAQMKNADNKYVCSELGCGKMYKRVGNLKNHLRAIHDWKIARPHKSDAAESSSGPSGPAVTSTFVKMALLARDMYDAYKHGDGNRVFRNAKQFFLYAECCHHTKYRLWMWRMIAMEKSVLSVKEAHEYKWNIAVNLQGGKGTNIPNDNLVELQVGAIKKLIQAQGANKSFQTAQVACKTSQIITGMRDQFVKINKTHRSSSKRPAADNTKDIDIMVSEILQANILQGVDDPRNLETFANFKDPLMTIDVPKLFSWVKEQKEILYAMYV